MGGRVGASDTVSPIHNGAGYHPNQGARTLHNSNTVVALHKMYDHVISLSTLAIKGQGSLSKTVHAHNSILRTWYVLYELFLI